MTERPKVIFILGGPGSGKGTHCDLMRERHHFVHFSVGDILREYLKSGTKEAAEISKKMKEGQMVSSKPIVESLKKKIKEAGPGQVVMIDGFPRNQENMTVWDEVIGNTFDVRLLLFIEVEDEVMKERLLNRGKTSGRLDDNEEVIVKRLATFHAETEPVVKHYKHLYKEGKTKVLSINGQLELEDVQKRIKKFLELDHLI